MYGCYSLYNEVYLLIIGTEQETTMRMMTTEAASPLGGAIGGVMGVVLVIIAVTVCVVVLIIFKRHSRQKHEGQNQQNRSIENAIYGGLR